MINVCVPVLRRYDLLRELLLSLERSTVVPNRVCIINNGRDVPRLRVAVAGVCLRLGVLTPKESLGVAASWNWFINNVEEERIIANDDVVFAPESLAKIIASKADIVWSSGFSCFLIRDTCVRKLGLFDEAISPGYGYYEDDDYLQRLDGRGTREPSAVAENVDAGVVHTKSGTLKGATHAEVLEHHRRFKIARVNYAKKWGLEEVFERELALQAGRPTYVKERVAE